MHPGATYRRDLLQHIIQARGRRFRPSSAFASLARIITIDPRRGIGRMSHLRSEASVRRKVRTPSIFGAGGASMTEQRIASEEVFRGRLLGVRVDRVRLPSGRASTREVVEHPGAVAVLPVLDDGRLVLVRQFRYAVGRALLEVPAGTREPGEADEATARRELREETGYEAAALEPLARYYISPGWCTEELVAFRATGLRQAGARPELDEALEVVVVEPADVTRLIAGGEIGDAKTITTLLAHLGGARIAPDYGPNNPA
jgi:ADP-ribose pyrophosphatase